MEDNKIKEGYKDKGVTEYGLRSINVNGIKESIKKFSQFGQISAVSALAILF